MKVRAERNVAGIIGKMRKIGEFFQCRIESFVVEGRNPTEGETVSERYDFNLLTEHVINI